MRNIRLLVFVMFSVFAASAQNSKPAIESFKNTWTTAPTNIPNNVSIDAPLMGNGDLTMTVGYKAGVLRFYLSKNDFWRLKSQSDNLSGPRVGAFLDISIEGLNNAGFTANQMIKNGITTCLL